MAWHQDQLQKTADPVEQEWHDELIIRDIGLLDQAKKEYENGRHHYKATGADVPDVNFD